MKKCFLRAIYRKTALTIVSAGLFVLALSKVRADVVVLQNGDRISGKIVERGPTKVTIATSYAGPITIPRGEVSRIESGKAAETTLTGGEASALAAEEIAMDGKDLVVDANPDAIELEEKKEWEGSVGLAMKLENGSSNADREIDGDMRLRWSRGPNRFRLNSQLEYDTTNKIATKQDWMVMPKYDRYFTDKAYWSVSYAAKQEKYEGLNLRQTVGPALGYEFFSNEKTELISEIGLYYASGDYTNGTSDSYAAPGWYLEYRRKVWLDRLEFYHRHLAFVRSDNTDQKIWHSWTGFKIPLHEGFNISTELELDYDDITLNRTSNLEDTIRLKFGYDW